jgi:hydroxyacyl-ACP dehydratase HTD2-like protein with hotdog domain
MLARTQFLHRAVCTAPYRRKWGRISQRSYSATGDNEPAWFTQLRSEMLSRDAIYFQEFPTAEHDTKLTRTLSGFLPAEWNSQSSFTGRLLIPGHHLIWFNSTPPTTELLPDGTDTLQSPGDAWVRRMWAGGSVELKPDGYFSKMGGFRVGRNFAGAERIKDVRLRGQGDTEKIFVIIERRFASKATLHASHNKALELSNTRDGADEKAYFLQQLRNDVEWGDAICKEERTLVFFKERTTAELDAIKAGQLAPVKYLERKFLGLPS